MPHYRVAANTYCPQTLGYGATSSGIQNSAGVFHAGGNFGVPHTEVLFMAHIPSALDLTGYYPKPQEGAKPTPLAAYELNAEPGTYSVSGFDATLLAARQMNAEPGAYSVTGFDATVVKGFALDAGPGTYNVTGFDATLLASRQMSADTGVYVVTGFDASLLRGSALNAEPGSYSVSGVDATLLKGFAVNAESGDYAITGLAADLAEGGAPPPAPPASTGGAWVWDWRERLERALEEAKPKKKPRPKPLSFIRLQGYTRPARMRASEVPLSVERGLSASIDIAAARCDSPRVIAEYVAMPAGMCSIRVRTSAACPVIDGPDLMLLELLDLCVLREEL